MVIPFHERIIQMKKTKIVLFIIMKCTMASVCWGQSYWEKTYGENFSDAYAVTPTPDGNFIVAGRTQSNDLSNYNYDVYILKIKPDGDTLWTKTYGGNDDYEAYAISPMVDGNFLVAGTASIFTLNETSVYLLDIRPNGDTIWTKTLGGTSEFANSLSSTTDGNFIVAGGGSDDVFILKIKPSGDTIWTKTYGGFLQGYASAVIQLADGNFFIAGTTMSTTSDVYNFYLLKISADGDTLWTKNYGGSYSYELRTIAAMPDGDFILGGYINYSSNGHYATYLVNIKPGGNCLG
jgi:WD40 repeat protein